MPQRGKFSARVNVDTAPGIVQALGLQAVPTVIALLNGQLAPLFQGVLAKDQVQAAIDQLLKAAVANGMVDAPNRSVPKKLLKSRSLKQILDTRRDAALERGDFAAAREEFDRLLQANPNDGEALAGKAQAGLFARAATLDPRPLLLQRMAVMI